MASNRPTSLERLLQATFAAPMLASVATLASACGDAAARTESGAPTATGATSSGSAKTEAEASFPEPVYPRTGATPDPLAVRLCDALHTLPAKRKAACCGGAPGVTMAEECARTLSFALRSKAIAIDPQDVDRCEEASSKAYEACDWITPLSAPVPPACTGILRGAMKEGDRCRSSLECEAGLRCHGVAASDAGRCGRPKEAGACSRGVDTLASYTRESDMDRAHPECAGHCNGRRCEPDVPVGGTCAASLDCGRDRRCVDRRCSDAPAPNIGEACPQGVCGGDARCVSGRCASPKKNGETCTDDRECSGSCERTVGESPREGAAPGVCTMLCSAKIPGSTRR